MTTALPVDAIREEVVSHWRQRGCLVQSPPGSGKTTRLPLWLLEQTEQEIILLLPRRLPVKLAARRLADQLAQSVGETVGYTLRHDSKRSSDTRLTVTTYGSFIRRLQQDPSLTGVSTVILDEYHERQLDQDICLTLLHSCRELFREDLKLLVMSATLTLDILEQALKLPTVESDGELHELTIHYRPSSNNNRTYETLRQVILEARKASQGHVLVFLPGLKAIETIGKDLPADIPRLIVHSQVPQDNLYQALELAEPTVILSTNIAESSVTLPDVRCVVDLGLERYPVVNPVTGLTELKTRTISKSSSRQRAGRAARMGPGLCYRLWTLDHQDRLAPDQPPEIAQADLKPLVMTLSHWGLSRDEAFWLTPPSAGRWEAALAQLKQWGALNARGTLSDHGKELVELGLDPVLAQLVVVAKQNDCLGDALWFAALQVLDRPLPEPAEEGLALASRQADAQLRQEATGLARRIGTRLPKIARALPDSVLLGAWPHRLIQVKEDGSGRGLLASGQAVTLDTATSRSGWYVLLSGQDRGHQIRARQVLPVSEASVLAELEATRRIAFHPERSRGQFTEQYWLGAFLCSERAVRPDAAQRCIAWRRWLASTPIREWPHTKTTTDWLDRFQILRSCQPEWPELPDSGRLAELAEPYLSTLSRLEQLDTVAVLEAWLGYDAMIRFNHNCPSHWQAPSGRRCPLLYQPQNNQVSASLKLQEAFGLSTTPSIAAGRQPITLNLTAPNGRVLAQVTDLPHFWENIYPEVRKEMRGRYNKHPWPENPLAAPATQATNRQLRTTNG